MVTQAELIVEVTRIIQDPSYTEPIQLTFINQAIQDIAGDPLVFLPDLETQGNVTTSTALSYVALPDTFQKKLFDCYNTTRHRHERIYGSLEDLQRRFSRLDQNGRIYGVAIRGSNLHYQRIPATAETLQLHFYRPPVDMTEDDDTPDGLPAHLARPLVVHHACAAIFSEIEQDLQGQKVNTLYHEGEANKQLAKLIAFIGPIAWAPTHISEEIDWEAYL
jgi:hypothetical protein